MVRAECELPVPGSPPATTAGPATAAFANAVTSLHESLTRTGDAEAAGGRGAASGRGREPVNVSVQATTASCI